MSEEEKSMLDDQQSAEEITPSSETHAITESATLSTQQETTNPKQEIKTMEVHHHPHVEKKSFKEYLLEGLMIFLAVTMGFFAESIRENITKHEKEHHLMEMLVEDLKADIPNLDTVVNNNSIKIEYLDSLRHCIYAAAEKTLPDTIYRNMYFMHRHYGRSRIEFAPTLRTLNQFEKNDAFNLIRTQAVSDSIQNYAASNKNVDNQHSSFRNFEADALAIGYAIFDYRYYENYLGNTRHELILQSTQQFKLLGADKKTFLAYGSKLYNSRGSLFNYMRFLKDHKAQAERLIALIEKEYHLK
jgi:hypothetical protein